LLNGLPMTIREMRLRWILFSLHLLLVGHET
jgi:hypothetical protein